MKDRLKTCKTQEMITVENMNIVLYIFVQYYRNITDFLNILNITYITY